MVFCFGFNLYLGLFCCLSFGGIVYLCFGYLLRVLLIIVFTGCVVFAVVWLFVIVVGCVMLFGCCLCFVYVFVVVS